MMANVSWTLRNASSNGADLDLIHGVRPVAKHDFADSVLQLLGVCELSEQVAFFEEGRVETRDRFSVLNYDAGGARQELQRDPHAKDSKELKAERHHSLKPKGV